MSKVATAAALASQSAPATLKNFWILTVENSSLTGKLTGLDIMAQLPVAVFENVNRVLGGVWSADDQNLYSMLAGRTDVVERDGQQQQLVTFEVVYNGGRYTFRDGVLNLDGTRIDHGRIEHYPLGVTPSTLAEDGTWSAQASPGGPGEEHGRPKPRRRTKRQRR